MTFEKTIPTTSWILSQSILSELLFRPSGFLEFLNFSYCRAIKSKAFRQVRFKAMHTVRFESPLSSWTPTSSSTLVGHIRKIPTSVSPNLASNIKAPVIDKEKERQKERDRSKLVHQCLRFEKELLLLEVYLVFGLWFTCKQVMLD